MKLSLRHPCHNACPTGFVGKDRKRSTRRIPNGIDQEWIDAAPEANIVRLGVLVELVDTAVGDRLFHCKSGAMLIFDLYSS